MDNDLGKARSRTPKHLRFARTCYRHMGGEMAVALHDKILSLGWLDGETYRLSTTGKQAFDRLGLSYPPPTKRRPLTCGCLDWSERRAHLGGPLGAALLTAFLQNGWVIRLADSRELQLTPAGREQLRQHFGLTF
ncbi:hypothetical protein [Paludibacterium purpuratum]|uniref:ArsR family transcriptional regulator n=1 Tax=Paludibacterium purpuratum TaxID=1144873 RepID=A0A4R7B2R7_9NEIS|nr:hypothetical protein [Paludibacterium purpuratum]TDR76454.1 hypothetical protein DFP86_11137 [Paludibacterium purpuratum]